MPYISPQGQVTYQGGEALPTFGTAAYNQAASGLIPQTNINPIINTGILTGSQIQPAVPTALPGTSPQSFMAGLPAIPLSPIGAVNPAASGALNATTGQLGGLENQRTSLLGRLQSATNQLLGRGQEQLRLETQQNIPGITNEVNSLSEQIASKKAAFDNAQAEVGNGTFGTGAQNARISALGRQQAVEVGGLSALLLAKQGKLDSAKSEVDRTLALEFDPIKQEIENTKTFLDLNYQDLSRVEKRQADALKIKLDREQQATKDFQDQKSQLLKYALENNPNQAFVQSILGAKSAKDLTKLMSMSEASGRVPKGTTAQFQAAGYANRQEQANGILEQLDPKIKNMSYAQFKLSLAAPNALQSPQMQQFSQAAKNFINAQLRRESGAAISPSEYKDALKQYIPAPGDSDAVLEQKKQNRLLNQRNLINEASTAYQPLGGALTPTVGGMTTPAGQIYQANGIHYVQGPDGLYYPQQ